MALKDLGLLPSFCTRGRLQTALASSGQGISISDPVLMPLCSFASVFLLRVFAGCLTARFVFGKADDLYWKSRTLSH